MHSQSEAKKYSKKKLLMLTDGNMEQASARIRAIQYIPLLEKVGFTVFLLPRVPVKPTNVFTRIVLFPIIKRFFWIKRLIYILFGSWDIVFIQRILIPAWAMQKLKNKTPIIFDFDDAIYLNKKRPSARFKTAEMVKISNEIVISTRFLDGFCNKYGKKGIIIPTPIETERIFPLSKIHHSLPTIGWIGSNWTTPYLKIIEPVLSRLSKEIPFRVLTIGANPQFKFNEINHISVPWSYNNENIHLGDIDIGIMPLTDDEFSRAKGGYKIYLYMAGGIPVVASSIGINQEIIRNGDNGFLAVNEDDWYLSLKKLLIDPNLRHEIGKAGRIDAIKYYDRKVCFNRLISIFERLLKTKTC